MSISLTKIYPHKWLPVAVLVNNLGMVEGKQPAKPKKEKIFKVKVKKIIVLEKKICVLCGSKYENHRHGKPYCDKHKAINARRWTFEPKGLQGVKKNGKI